MAEIKVVVDDGRRARNIVIGIAVVFVLSYWHFTGTLPFVAESMMPQPADAKLTSTWSIAASLLGDVFYFIGIAATGILSGAWSLAVGLVGSLLNKTKPSTEPSTAAYAAYATKSDLDLIASQILATVQGPLNELESKLNELCEPSRLAETSQSDGLKEEKLREEIRRLESQFAILQVDLAQKNSELIPPPKQSPKVSVRRKATS